MRHVLGTPDTKKKLLMFAGDVLLIAVIIGLVLVLYGFFREHHILRVLRRPLRLYALYTSAVLYIMLLYIFEMYEIGERHEKVEMLTSMLVVAFVSLGVMFALARLLRINKTTMIYLFAFFLLSVFPLFLWRRVFGRVFLSSEYFARRTLFVGTDSLTKEILGEMERSDYRAEGLLCNDQSDIASYEGRLAIVTTAENPGSLIRERGIRALVVALSSQLGLPLIKDMYRYKFEGLEVYRSDYFYEILTRKFPIAPYLEDGSIPFPSIDGLVSPVFRKTKRAIDFLGSLGGLVVLSPFLLIVAVLIKLTSRGPLFYAQERVGFQERPFKLIKFRTMIHEAEEDSGPKWASKGDRRITKAGRFLRKTRLDELPQLINVLKGDLTLVGPRPFRKHFVDMFGQTVPFYSLKFSIKPGLTGWAQVNHSYKSEEQSLEDNIERLQYDLYYLKNASLFLDLFIILKTLQTLVRRPAY